MATNFPSSLDNSTTIPAESAVTTLSTNHVTAHQNLQDAVEAIEAKLGVDGSAVTTSHDYKLGEVTSTDKAVGKTATQTLTNKTLTSPVINVGSDATGDIYYRNAGALTRLPIGTDNYILKVNGTVPNWEAETSVVNGSTTVAGIFEAATSAEVTAGTATGGTGAVLVVTPDALAASTPTFSGLGITNSVRLTRLAGYATATNTTENTVYTTSIGANLLSTNGMIRVKTPWTATTNTNAETFTIRLKYGGSTLASLTHTCNAVGGGINSTYNGVIEATIVNNAATNSQNVTFAGYGGILWTTASNLTPNNLSGNTDTTSAIDTTSSQTLTMTVQRTTGGANIASGTFLQTTVETIKNV